MTKALMIGAIALALAATSATAADFAGPSVNATLGYNDSTGNGGFSAGIGAGYDFAVTPTFRLGALAGVNFSTATQTVGAFDVNYTNSYEIGGRIGAVVSKNVLLYVKSAYASQHITGNYSGYRFGGGAEYAFTPAISGVVAYDYSNYVNGFYANDVKVGAAYRF